MEKELKEEAKMALARQASIEKQQVYEDAFLEQMNYYIQFGKTDGTYYTFLCLSLTEEFNSLIKKCSHI